MKSLIKELKKYKVTYVAIHDPTSIDKIHNLFCHGVLFEPQNTIEYLYVGLYYKTVKQNYAKAKHYYLIAVDCGDSYAMYNLGAYYDNIKHNYTKAKNYYVMAINHGNTSAMNNLAFYYHYVKKKYAKAKHYYYMAIDHGHVNAMYNLARYYDDIQYKYIKAKQYYYMAIDHGHVNAMHNLAIQYEYVENDYTSAQKYYLMAIDNDGKKSILYLARLSMKMKNYENAEKYFNMAIDNDCEDAYDKSFEFYKNVLKNEKKLLKFCVKYNKQIEREKIINVIEILWNSELDSKLCKYFVKLLLEFEILISDNVLLSLMIFYKMLHQNIKIINLHFEFTIDSIGYIAAKQDFDKIINT